MDEKRRKGLCYHYEEKWNPSHVYKTPRVYLLRGEETVVDEKGYKMVVVNKNYWEKIW